LVEVEVVEGCQDLVGEGADALAQPVVGGERLALGGQRVALLGGVLLAGVEVFGAALQLDQVHNRAR
jgi:hypothetical protein